MGRDRSYDRASPLRPALRARFPANSTSCKCTLICSYLQFQEQHAPWSRLTASRLPPQCCRPSGTLLPPPCPPTVASCPGLQALFRELSVDVTKAVVEGDDAKIDDRFYSVRCLWRCTAAGSGTLEQQQLPQPPLYPASTQGSWIVVTHAAHPCTHYRPSCRRRRRRRWPRRLRRC